MDNADYTTLLLRTRKNTRNNPYFFKSLYFAMHLRYLRTSARMPVRKKILKKTLCPDFSVIGAPRFFFFFLYACPERSALCKLVVSVLNFTAQLYRLGPYKYTHSPAPQIFLAACPWGPGLWRTRIRQQNALRLWNAVCNVVAVLACAIFGFAA